jgi:hypothetical protein
LGDGLTSLEESRRESEKKLEKEWKDTPYVGFDELESERRQPKPTMLLTIRDASGEVVRTLTAPAKKGFHRVAWDLTYPTSFAIQTASSGGRGGGRRGGDPNSGFMAPPASYSVTLSTKVDGVVTDVAGPENFEVTRVFKGVLDGTPPTDTAAFMQNVAALQRSVSAASQAAAIGFKTIDNLEKAIARSTVEPGTLDTELEELKQELYEIDEALSGNSSRRSMGEPRVPTVSGRLRVASRTNGQSDYGPTATHRRAFEIASEEFSRIEPDLRQLLEVSLPALEAKMEDAGVPWTPGRPLPAVR